MSDRIAIMHEGEVRQVGSPTSVYERPASAFVADFLGESNFLAGVAEASGADETIVRLADGRAVRTAGDRIAAGSPATAMVRPESVRFADAPAGPNDNTLDGVIAECEFLGQSTRYLVDCGGQSLTVREPRHPAGRMLARGTPVTLAWSREATLVYPTT